MSIDKVRFGALCRTLSAIDLFGSGPPSPPWGSAPTVSGFRQAIESHQARLPLAYQAAYVAPVLTHADRILAEGYAAETIGGAVYDHASSHAIDRPLDRFLAVISNFYRSFLNARRRAKAAFPIVGDLPPLATFKHEGAEGPFTIPADEMRRLCDARVGVVSLPSTYRDHPVLWASLAHETGGHDVLHADEGLLAELASGVWKLFGGQPIRTGHDLTMPQFQGLLWSYWIDEAASDVYGLLNIGPAFALNLAAFFSALNSERGQGRPSLRADSGSDEEGWLDPHPTDLLRLFLAIGVTNAQKSLAAGTRRAYADDFAALADLCAGGARSVRLQGSIPITRDRALNVDTRVSLGVMQEAAIRVGSYIATARLRTLGKHAIQEIETWDDADEGAASRIAATLRHGAPISGMGDDAQLLAGATLALVENPARYGKVTAALNDALDNSFALDPIWGKPKTDHAYVRTEIVERYQPRRGWLAQVGSVAPSQRRAAPGRAIAAGGR